MTRAPNQFQKKYKYRKDRFLRPFFERAARALLWPGYRVRGYGPGHKKIPKKGPLLFIANHTAFLDPLWMLPIAGRQFSPLMVSRFYDLPGVQWIMRDIVHAIRVQENAYRHYVPEITEAINRLDQGEAVMIFPEGWLKRHERVMLRMFGQGVWRILVKRPETAIIPFWIDGGWGSYTSYEGGPPMKNKPLDWFRPINIVVGEAIHVPTELLADHRQTRAYLMKVVVGLRKWLPDAHLEDEEEVYRQGANYCKGGDAPRDAESLKNF